MFLLTLFAVTAGAQDSQTGYNFLRIPVSAHAAALGGENITIIEDDPSLMFSNPALLASVSDKSINLNFMTYMAGGNHSQCIVQPHHKGQGLRGRHGSVYGLRKDEGD